jgi:hypothetical protein
MGCLVNNNIPPPLFCVSAESKGLSGPVSSLYATFAGGRASVDSARVRRAKGQRSTRSRENREMGIGEGWPPRCFCKIVTGKELTGGGCTKI